MSTTAKQVLKSAVSERVSWAGEPGANDFGGLDFPVRGRSGGATSIRFVPIDGEWDAGVEVYVFDSHMTLLRNATVQGATIESVAVIADALVRLS